MDPYTTPPFKLSHQIICLACGKALQILSHRHLALHSLTAETYKYKYDPPQQLMLCAATLADRRRQLAQKLSTVHE